ncbi:MAG TPA: type II and III secretion system protein family protein [Rhizomicrobium sp.]|nr:type II and III secretion system protein family protein [Rhizomicrobium sp.]HWA70021.1 type II and III secretion system protein family protein [Rhizomicrobium sp.]
MTLLAPRKILLLSLLPALVATALFSQDAGARPALDDANARVLNISTQGGASSHQRLTLSLDKAAVVQLDTDARDVLVSNPDLVDAVVRTPRRIFLLATKVGQTNAFFFGADGKQILTLDIRVEKDVVDLAGLMKMSLPNSAINVQAMNDNIVLTGSVASALESTRAADLAARFAGDPKKVINMLSVAGGAQVMLKVRIAEMDRNVAKQFGIDLTAAGKVGGVPLSVASSNPYGLLGRALSDLSGGQAGSVCSGAFNPTTATTTTTTAIANTSNNPALLEPGTANGITNVLTSATPCNSPNNAQGVLKALERVGLVHMLAEPNLTAVSGETAKFLAGGEFPVPAGRDQQGNVSVQFKQFGVGLSFTPVVISPGRISLQLSSEVSELTNTGSFTLNGAGGTGVTIPALSVRRTETTVELPSGGSFAVAGLMQHNTKQVIDGFPGVKDLPVLGALFRSRDFADDQTELVVLVSAYLVEPNAESAFVSPTDGFVAPTDPETLLLGRLNAVYRKKPGDKPIQNQAAEPVGFVVR